MSKEAWKELAEIRYGGKALAEMSEATRIELQIAFLNIKLVVIKWAEAMRPLFLAIGEACQAIGGSGDAHD
jgi:hypothetical protein